VSSNRITAAATVTATAFRTAPTAIAIGDGVRNSRNRRPDDPRRY